MSNDEWDILDIKALGSIRLCLAPSMPFNITKAKTTEDLMKTLATLYENPFTSNKVFLMKHLFNMEMVDEGRLRVDRFNGKNFQLWKMHMEDYLYQKDLWKSLEGKTKN